MTTSENVKRGAVHYQMKVSEKGVYITKKTYNEQFDSYDSEESSYYQDLSFSNNGPSETQKQCISGVFDERVSLGYKYITNNIEGTSKEDIYRVLQDEENKEMCVKSEPPSDFVENSVVEPNTNLTTNCDEVTTKSITEIMKKRFAEVVKKSTFSCDDCCTSFNSYKNLKEHFETSRVCTEKLYCCHCSFSTDDYPTLKLHVAFEHNNDHCSDAVGISEKDVSNSNDTCNEQLDSDNSKESSCYQDVSSSNNGPCKIEEQKHISGVFDERESLGYKYVTNNIEGTSKDDIYNIFHHEEDNNKMFIKSEPSSNFDENSVIESRKSFTKKCDENLKKSINQILKKSVTSVVKKSMFSCDSCCSSFTSNRDLKDHYETSDVCAKKFFCFMCSYSTDHSPTLKLHLAFEHNCTESFSCFHCSHVVGSKLSVQKHIKINHLKKLPCNYLVQSKGRLKKRNKNK